MADFFTDIPAILYKPERENDDVLSFKYYNAKEVIHGKTMEEWLRFSVCYWHSFRGIGQDMFGDGTIVRPWDTLSNDTLDNLQIAIAKQRMDVAFNFMSRIGIKYWTFHDVDIAPEGSTIKEFQNNLDIMTDHAMKLQQKTGIKPLWVTCNLFSNPRYMNGAATSPDSHVVAYAAAQVKKGLDIALKLGADNFVFWGGREGYQTILNTNIFQELSNMANFFRMAIAYKEKIGYKGQFLIEPKPKEPTKHQYDYDAMTVIGFLKTFQLDAYFKINVEPNHTTLAGHSYEHDVVMASAFGMLGSIDANTGSPDLGWDTDQFPMDIKNCTLIMKTVIEQGGIGPGGLNFDAKVRRESTDIKDLFIGHIGAMDAFARGLRIAAKIVEDGILKDLVEKRYESFDYGIGQSISLGMSSLEACYEYIIANGNPPKTSAHQELYESILNNYI